MPQFKLPKGEASLNYLIRTYKKNAKRRNIRFSLTKDQFRAITKKNCYYCNIAPYAKATNTGRFVNGSYIYNGIDRLDNKKGYTKEKIVYLAVYLVIKQKILCTYKNLKNG